MVVVLILVFMILFPTLIKLLQGESRGNVRRTQSDRAFRVAEAGISRAYAFLSQSRLSFSNAASGVVPVGYQFDSEYQEGIGGISKIRISSGPILGQVTVESKGRDPSTQETRSIRAVYRPAVFDSALNAKVFEGCTGALRVHWGPWKYSNRMILANCSSNHATADLHYPRKFSPGLIDTPVFDPLDTFPSSSSAPVTPPALDFDYYKDKAKASSVPLLNGDGGIYKHVSLPLLMTAEPPGSGYFPVASWVYIRNSAGSSSPTTYSFLSSTSVIFFDNPNLSTDYSLQISTGVYLEVEALISRIGYSWNTKTLLSGPGGGTINATIPEKADLEYVHPVANAVWTGGGPSMQSVWSVPTRCCWPVNNVLVKGFLYTQGKLAVLDHTGVNRPTISGAVYIGETFGSWAHIEAADVYYDDSVAQQVRLTDPPVRVQYKEVSLPWN